MITKKFLEELSTLLNKHSIDSLCHTPDNLLAQHLCDYLDTYQKTIRAVARHEGKIQPEYTK